MAAEIDRDAIITGIIGCIPTSGVAIVNSEAPAAMPIPVASVAYTCKLQRYKSYKLQSYKATKPIPVASVAYTCATWSLDTWSLEESP